MRWTYIGIFFLTCSVVVLLILPYVEFITQYKPIVIDGNILGENISVQRKRTSEITPTPTEIKSKEVEPIYGLPMRLVIPKINVDTGILHLGVTEDGDMEVPVMIKDVGWYKYGSNPGMKGSAVIAGHLGVETPGIFADLDKLQKGDVFLVVDDKNQTISFVVKEIRTYNSDERPNEVFFSSDGYHLNLITCAGEWDNANLSMTKRLVVFSDRI